MQCNLFLLFLRKDSSEFETNIQTKSWHNVEVSQDVVIFLTWRPETEDKYDSIFVFRLNIPKYNFQRTITQKNVSFGYIFFASWLTATKFSQSLMMQLDVHSCEFDTGWKKKKAV